MTRPRGDQRPRTMTLLFTDLVGYSSMTVRLGAAADDLVRTYFDLLRGAVTAAGGHEVKGLGDGIMAAFDSAAAAVDCAVGMQQSMERHNRRGGEPLLLRVGLSAGDVVEQDSDYYGVAPIEASRLCDVAEGGQILASAALEMLGGRRPTQEFRSVGQLDLKGLDAPTAAFEILWAPAADVPAAPLPPALVRHAEGATFVGRRRELGSLWDLWQRALAGERQAAFLCGEAGIGKTRLMAEHGQKAHATGACVLYGGCDPDLRIPFAPFVAAFRDLVATADADLLGDHARRYGGELARIVPELFARVPGLPAPQEADPDTEQFRLFEAADGLLRAAVSRAPALVFLDDLHWADKPTLILLRHLVRGPDAPLLFVAAHRDAPLEQGEDLRDFLAEISREPRSIRIDVEGLPDQDAMSLLENVVGGRVDEGGEQFAQELRRETEGNPFFMMELLRDVGDIRALAETGGWSKMRDRVRVPQTLRDLLVKRLRLLDPAVRGIVESAALVGPEIDLDLLVAATGEQEPALYEALEHARAAALVRSDPTNPRRFAFSHAIVQQAFADDVAAGRRVVVHRRLADALEEAAQLEPRRIGELARHRIASGDVAAAKEAATRAGEQALDVLAPDEAVRWFAKALELFDEQGGEPLDRLDFVIRLGEAERRAGDERFAVHLAEAAREARRLGDGDRLARAALANNRGMFSTPGSVDRDRVAMLEAALGQTDDRDSARRALLLATLSSELWLGDHDRRIALSDEAVEIARRVGDERLLMEVLYRRCMAVAEPATLDQRLSLTAEMLELSDSLGDPFWGCLASAERGRAAIESCDIDEGLYHARRQRQLAAQSANAYARHVSAWAEPWPLALTGRLTEAEEAAQHAFAESASSHQPDAVPILGSFLMVARWDQGRLDELVEFTAGISVEDEAAAAHRAVVAFMRAEIGQTDAAADAVESAARREFELPRDALWLAGMLMWGEACARVGHTAGLASCSISWSPGPARSLSPASRYTERCRASWACWRRWRATSARTVSMRARRSCTNGCGRRRCSRAPAWTGVSR